MESSILIQFISDENLTYLKSKMDIKRKDLEIFIDNHKHDIKLNKDFWWNIRHLNKLFLQLKNFAKPEKKEESLRVQFLSGKNIAYLEEKSGWDTKAILAKASEFASNDLYELLESGEVLNLNIINQEFLSGMSGGTYEEQEAFHDKAFKYDSLGVKHGLNDDDNGKFHIGPYNQDGYDGNKVNRFEIYTKQRQPKIPFYQNLSHRNIDRDDTHFGQGNTEWEQPVRKQLFSK